jgi:glucose/arabinose dehydrogenase
VAFGRDGLLYLGPGDGGGGGDPDDNAQNRGRLLGKILRIRPRPGGGYDVPASNPFAGGGGAREVFAYGLRNPYRFSFDRRTGAMTIGDVGQDAVEEANYVRRPGNGGFNFGWPVFEGTRRTRGGSPPGHRTPFVQRSHDQGWCSITGGYVIRDRSLPRRLRGKYVFGDLCDPRLRIASVGGGRARQGRALGVRVSGLVSFGEDARGRVHAVSLEGPVYRLARRR